MRFIFGLCLLFMPTCTQKSSSGSGFLDTFFPIKSMEPASSLNLVPIDRYGSCEEFRQDLEADLLITLEAQWKSALYAARHPIRYDERVQASSDDDSDAAGTSAASEQIGTNLQVHGVDEGDLVKMNSRYLFVADNQRSTSNSIISILSKNPLARVGELILQNIQTPQLYVTEEHLIVTGNQFGSFTIQVYDITQKPSLISETRLPAMPVDTRMIGSKLFVVLLESLMKKSVPWPSPQQLKGSFEDYASSIAVDAVYDLSHCEKTVKLGMPGGVGFMQHVLAYDTSTARITDELFVPGASTALYMTGKNLYIYGSPTLRRGWLNPNDQATAARYQQMATEAQDHLLVQKIGLDADNGLLLPKAAGIFRGHLKVFDASWAFHEIEQTDETLLALALSSGSVMDPVNNPAANHLLILRESEKNLVEAAALRDFGRNEDIRSVRYVGSLAYVVTFKRTDPLFTIDLSQPLQPKITGELKIPGFSLYLHPQGPESLLGLGYQTEDSLETDIDRVFFQGVLFQLFDVKDPTAASRLAAVELGKRGSYSDANQDHKAFYYDAGLNLAAVPAVLFDDGKPDDARNGNLYHQTLAFSGAVFYRIEDQTLVEAKRISHAPYLSPNCIAAMQPLGWTTPIQATPDVRRIFRDGASIFAISNYAVTRLDATTLNELQTVQLAHSDCWVFQTPGGVE